MLGLNNLWIPDYEIMKSKYEEQMTSQRVFELEWCAAWVDSWNELRNMSITNHSESLQGICYET